VDEVHPDSRPARHATDTARVPPEHVHEPEQRPCRDTDRIVRRMLGRSRDCGPRSAYSDVGAGRRPRQFWRARIMTCATTSETGRLRVRIPASQPAHQTVIQPREAQ
jgi:hypothetical protein